MRTHGVFGVFPTRALTEVVGRTLYPKSDWAKAAHREFARRAVSGQVRSSHMRRLIVRSGVMNPKWIEPHAHAWDPLAGWGYSKHRHIAFEHLDMRIEFDGSLFHSMGNTGLDESGNWAPYEVAYMTFDCSDRFEVGEWVYTTEPPRQLRVTVTIELYHNRKDDSWIEIDFGSFDVPIRVPGSPSQVP